MIMALLFMLFLHMGVNYIGYSLAGSQPAITAVLTAGVVASSTTIPVSSVDGFPDGGWLFIDGEAMQYTGKTDTCPAPFAAEPACFTTVSRGQQSTVPASHLAGSRVYNEAAGLTNSLSNFESRTSIDELGDITTPWSSGTALVQFLGHSTTWDWPMFEGDFAIFRVFGALFTIAVSISLFIVLATILTGAIRRLTGG